MSDETDDTSEDTGKKGKKGKKGGGRSNLIPAVVLALGLAAGGYFMSGSSSDASASEEPAKEEPVPGGVATMDPLSVNLADGHFLKVGIALELVEGVEVGEFMKGEISKAKDLIIDRMGGLPMEQLTSPDGRKAIKEELAKAARKLYKDEVIDIYFTVFVMQ